MIALNPKAQVRLNRVGRDAVPVLVIDDLCLDPDDLVAAAAAAGWAPPDGTFYPGLNAPLPPDYLPEIYAGLSRSLVRAFGEAFTGAMSAHGFFALATWRLESFGPWQRIPHYDQPHPAHLAMVHYLGKGQGGGTGFFRHDATGYEWIDAGRREGYLSGVTDWIGRQGDQLSTHAGPETPGYTMTDQVDFAFNRAVIYPSYALHCALFDGARLGADPRAGRLTANSFFYPAAA